MKGFAGALVAMALVFSAISLHSLAARGSQAGTFSPEAAGALAAQLAVVDAKRSFEKTLQLAESRELNEEQSAALLAEWELFVEKQREGKVDAWLSQRFDEFDARKLSREMQKEKRALKCANCVDVAQGAVLAARKPALLQMGCSYFNEASGVAAVCEN